MSLFDRFKTVAKARVVHAQKELQVYSFDSSRIGHVDGISICDSTLSGDEHSQDRFLRVTQKALGLLRTLDPRRHCRVCRQLKYIVNMPLGMAVAQYQRNLQACPVDAEKWFILGHENNARFFACVLVHEATHGVLEEKLILYTKDKRERIESLCHKEEYRFGLHFGQEWADQHVGPFRPELWESSWNGIFVDRVVALWKRLNSEG